MLRFNKERHDFGLLGESVVLPLVEQIIGEPILKTSSVYDTVDGESENYLIEIKTRTSRYHWTDALIEQEGWLIPACKIERAQTSTKKVCFYYYWTADKSLWELEYSPDVFAQLTPTIPPWHADHQRHYYVKRNEWTLIEFQD